MIELVACEYNMDSGCVELRLSDGTLIAIHCTEVENEVADNMYQRSELDWLIYNDPLAYADLKLNKIQNGSPAFESLCCRFAVLMMWRRGLVLPNRNRNIQLNFRVSENEKEHIGKKMEIAGVINREAYLRKMAMDGCILKLDLPELKEIISLMRRMSNNINQIAKRMNETGRLYETDIQEIIQNQERLWDGIRELLSRLTKLQ